MTEWILTSSVLILLVIAVRGLFKEKMKAKYTYALWLLVLVRLLCPVNFGELSFNLLSLAEEGKEQVEERIGEREEAQASQRMMQNTNDAVYVNHGNLVTVLPYYAEKTEETFSYFPERVTVADAAMAEHTPEVVPVMEDSGFQLPEINWQKVLPVAWAVGMVLIAIVITSVNISFSTMLGLFRKELPAFTRKGRGKQSLSVYLADGINSSCLYGVVRPSIYLNKKGMGEQEKKYCVEHEYSHYLQGDMVWSLCRTVCLILHWYNPLVWLAVVLSKKDAELACDERTIERLGEEERYSYGHTLVELAASQSRVVQMFGMATLMASDKKEVVNRVKAITTKKQTKIITGLLVVCLLVGIGCFVFTGVAKGEQENNNPLPTVTATPTPTEVPTVAPTEEPTLASTEEPTPTPTMGMMSNIPGEEYVYARVPGKNLYQREEGIDIRDEVEYQEISFVDTLQVNPEKGKGWKLDLDGDGTKELFYLDELRGIYINDVLVQWMDFCDGCELSFLDIDTTDGIYEIAIDGNAYYYDGTSLQKVTNFIEQSWSSGNSFVSDIVNFERVDEHTISFLNYNRICHAIIRSNFVLDENHQLKLAEGSNNYNAEHVHEKSDMRRDKTVRGFSVIDYVAELENQSYTEITFIDHIKLETADGEGWLVDLDGDGTKEQICIYDNSVCVNGYAMIHYLAGTNSCIWLLDIDTTDGIYEILLEDGSLWIYNGSKLTWVWSLWNYFWMDGCVYQGKLSEFTRIDEHTISFENIDRGTATYENINGYKVVTYNGTDDIAEYQYRLNENHELVLLENEAQ